MSPRVIALAQGGGGGTWEIAEGVQKEGPHLALTDPREDSSSATSRARPWGNPLCSPSPGCLVSKNRNCVSQDGDKRDNIYKILTPVPMESIQYILTFYYHHSIIPKPEKKNWRLQSYNDFVFICVYACAYKSVCVSHTHTQTISWAACYSRETCLCPWGSQSGTGKQPGKQACHERLLWASREGSKSGGAGLGTLSWGRNGGEPSFLFQIRFLGVQPFIDISWDLQGENRLTGSPTPWSYARSGPGEAAPHFLRQPLLASSPLNPAERTDGDPQPSCPARLPPGCPGLYQASSPVVPWGKASEMCFQLSKRDMYFLASGARPLELSPHVISSAYPPIILTSPLIPPPPTLRNTQQNQLPVSHPCCPLHYIDMRTR